MGVYEICLQRHNIESEMKKASDIYNSRMVTLNKNLETLQDNCEHKVTYKPAVPEAEEYCEICGRVL